MTEMTHMTSDNFNLNQTIQDAQEYLTFQRNGEYQDDHGSQSSSEKSFY